MTRSKKSTENEVVKPGKELIASKADGITKKLLKKVNEGITRITMDLSAVKKMDSVGLGMIMATHNTLKNAGEGLALIKVSQEISRVFNAMGFGTHIKWDVIE